MKKLFEKILLEEPEQELPAVDITGPITVTDTEIAQVDEVSPEVEKDAFISLLSSEVSKRYADIDSFNSVKATISASNIDEATKETVIDVFEDFIDTRTMEIGAIQTLLEEFDPDMKSLIADGQASVESESEEESVVTEESLDDKKELKETMLKKDIKEIDNIVKDEWDCGHYICDFDDYRHDLKIMAEVLDVELVWDENDHWSFKNEKDKARVEDALQYYYDSH